MARPEESIGITWHNHRFYLAWFVDGEEGGLIGESPTQPDENASIRALCAAKLDGNCDLVGPFWDTEKEAKRALKVAVSAWHAHLKSKPLPAWASTALAAGWKAPKGWAP